MRLPNQFQSTCNAILSKVKCNQVLCFENDPFQPFGDLIKCTKKDGGKKSKYLNRLVFFELDWSYWHLGEWLPLWGMYIEELWVGVLGGGVIDRVFICPGFSWYWNDSHPNKSCFDLFVIVANRYRPQDWHLGNTVIQPQGIWCPESFGGSLKRKNPDCSNN